MTTTESKHQSLISIAVLCFGFRLRSQYVLFRESEQLDVFDALAVSMPRAWYWHIDAWVLVF